MKREKLIQFYKSAGTRSLQELIKAEAECCNTVSCFYYNDKLYALTMEALYRGTAEELEQVQYMDEEALDKEAEEAFDYYLRTN